MQYFRGHHAYIIIWKPLVSKCLQDVKEPTNEANKNAVVVPFRTDRYFKEQLVSYV